MDLQLKINGKICDLSNSDTDFNFDFAIYDNNTLANIKASTTNRNVKLPANKTNKEIFNNYGEISQGLIPAQFEFPCSVWINDFPLIMGKCYLQKAVFGQAGSDYQLKVKEYEVLIIGDNADCFTDIRELYLRDCITEPPHTQTPALMNAGLQADYDSGDKYGYLPIQYTTTAVANEFSVGELTPYYFALSLVEDIFKKVDYTVDSTFLYSDSFKRLAFPLYPIQKYPPEFSADYLNIVAENSAEVFYPAWSVLTFPFDQQTQIPAIGNPYNVGTYQYTCPYKGFYRVQCSFKLQWDSIGTNDFFAILPLKNGTPPPPPFGAIKYNVVTGDKLEIDTVFECDFGDILTINTGLSVGTGISVKNASFRVTGEALYRYGRTDNYVNLAYLTRDWKALDFIKGLVGNFNLACQANPVTKTVRIEPKDDYIYTHRESGASFLQQGFYQPTLENFEQRLRLNQPADIENGTDKGVSVIMKMKDDDNDFYLKKANASTVNDFKAGSSWYKPPLLKANKDIELIENPFFAATMHRRAADLSQPNPLTNDLGIIQIPILFAEGQVNFEDLTFNFQPRLLYVRVYGSAINDGYWRYNNGTAATVEKYYPAFAVNGLDTDGLDWNLHYANEINGFILSAGLAKRYYLRQMGRDLLGNTLKCFAYFSPLDILNIDFSKKLKIAQGVFILQAINNYQPTSPSAPCQIELQQDNLNPPDYFQTGQPTTLNIIE